MKKSRKTRMPPSLNLEEAYRLSVCRICRRSTWEVKLLPNGERDDFLFRLTTGSKSRIIEHAHYGCVKRHDAEKNGGTDFIRQAIHHEAMKQFEKWAVTDLLDDRYRATVFSSLMTSLLVVLAIVASSLFVSALFYYSVQLVRYLVSSYIF